MKRASIAVAVLVALTLTGCAGAPDTAGDERTAPSATESAVPDEAVSPLVAETASPEDAEAAFIEAVRDRLAKIRTQIPDATDEQLLDAGKTACARLDAGESGENMTLIEGEELTNGYYMDSGAIIIAARMTLCPID